MYHSEILNFVSIDKIWFPEKYSMMRQKLLILQAKPRCRFILNRAVYHLWQYIFSMVLLTNAAAFYLWIRWGCSNMISRLGEEGLGSKRKWDDRWKNGENFWEYGGGVWKSPKSLRSYLTSPKAYICVHF